MQRVHAFRRTTCSPTWMRYFWMLGIQVRRVFRLEWLTLFPATACFPQKSQRTAKRKTPFSVVICYHKRRMPVKRPEG